MRFEPAAELGNRHAAEPRLIHAVAVADGDLAVLERLEVHRDAERGADLVLATVELADVAARVVRDHPPLPQIFVHPAGRFTRSGLLRKSGTTHTL